MTLEPFRSATVMSIGQSGDTSLSVPSDNRMVSAQQRVMDQVQTTARRKSRYSTKSASGIMSPTSKFSTVYLSIYLSNPPRSLLTIRLEGDGSGFRFRPICAHVKNNCVGYNNRSELKNLYIIRY